ncbi:MAG: DUF5674 family protein [Patescibacteria group bacterium]|nr:DUF5674 family protein [Patescibacteria group bacterium]MCL5224059.1 DUF5674 family protein [Patescibacteria group bacterium]
MIVDGRLNKDSIEKPFSKAAVDIVRKMVSIGGEFHVDCAEELVENGSLSKDIWGVSVYPDGHIDFISLINVRPAQGNKVMDVTDKNTRDAISKIIEEILE